MNGFGNDTIAAIATAAGGGIGIVRISGPDALALAGRIFRGRAGRSLASAPPFRLVLGEVAEPVSGAAIDEALAVHMPAGRSYTGDPTVEVQAHGGRLVLDAILQAAVAAGARPAGPGEFTRRAFLAGRLDLTQAEAVAALVTAETEAQRRAALVQLQGGVADRISSLRERLLDLSSRVEAALDFEEDGGPASLPDAAEIEAVARDLRILAAQAGDAHRGREGVRVVFAGRPNTGKSSLFNYLLERDRSIVSSVPGTTRDYVEERSAFGGVSVTLVDTAGFRESDDLVEAEGVRRTIGQLEEADIVVLVQDGSEPIDPDDARLIEVTARLSPIVVVSKADLPAAPGCRGAADPCADLAAFRLSTLTGEGCSSFAEALGSRCRSASGPCFTEAAPPGIRHRDALERAACHVGNAGVHACRGGGALDRVSLELRSGLQALGEITGETATDEILDRVFSRFCIGK